MSDDDPRAAIVASRDGVRLRVRLTPRSGRDRIGAFERLADGNEVLVVHVRALPAEGAANAALVALLAAEVGVPKSKLAVVAGHASRVKTVAIPGAAGEIAAILMRLAGTGK